MGEAVTVLNPEITQEACARVCLGLAEIALNGRDNKRDKRKGKIRKRAFMDAARIIRSMDAESLIALLNAAAPSADS